MLGLFNINKPPGITSRDVVNHVQRIVRPAKVGHAGTLDPLATGVLVLCVGRATRLIQYVQQLPKRYTATFLLGRQSATDDTEGEVTELAGARRPDADDILAALTKFVGTIQQRPPAYSSIKVDGKRSYHLARAGKEVELEARPVVIHDIELNRYQYPELTLDICCGSGTYVRSLGRDLAEQLGTGAVMSQLVRTAIGEFTIAEACEIDDLTAESLASYLLPAADAVARLPVVKVTASEIARLANGMTIDRSGHGIEDEAAALDSVGQLVSVVCPRGPDRLRPLHNFGTPQPPSGEEAE